MISYRATQTSHVNDGFSQILREAAEYFAGHRIQMMGSGFQEILSDPTLFDTYVSKLTEGLSADEAAQVEQLLDNCRTHIFSEASITGIQPISSLSMPTVRKMWSRVSLKHAIPTEPVKQPKFTISYMEPYLLDPDGTKHPLPQALRENIYNNHAEKVPLDREFIPMEEADRYDLLAPVQASIAVGDAIDPVFYIDGVKMTVTDADGNNPEEVEVEVLWKMDTGNYSIYGEVSANHSDGTAHRDTFFAHVDLQGGTITASSLKGLITDFRVRGWLSSENNARTQSISFDIKTKDVTIGTGAHLNAPLPIEWLQDTMAMFKIDGAVEVVDLMSNVTATKLEQEIIQFLEDSYKNTGEIYRGRFDVHPSAGFSGSPKDWRDELRTVIDYWAIKMKKDSAFTNGKFVIMGSPLDTALIPNVNWVFNHANEEVGGVEVDFNLGATSGANRYEIVSSDHFEDGKLIMIYVPSTPKQMTYKYYPYTFNVENGYTDPNRPYVPSVMMTKRHTIEELTPLICEIEIINNDGTLPS